MAWLAVSLQQDGTIWKGGSIRNQVAFPSHR